MSALDHMNFVAHTVEDLDNVAGQLITFCGERRVVAFHGEMGAGKTTFIRNICTRLGVEENVSSPTFSIINEYVSGKAGRVFHFDFYRLNKPEEALTIGVEEYFESGDWCLVEWPEKILYLIPQHRVDVFIAVNDSARLIRFNYA